MKNLIVALVALCISAGASATGLLGGNVQGQDQNQGQAQAQGQLQGQGQAQASFNKNSNTNRNTNVAGASAGAVSGAFSGGNDFSAHNETDIRPAATASAPGLTSIGSDNCLGSTSFGAGNGFFAVSGGTTTESAECNRRAYSRALAGLGQTKAALALLCKNEEVASVTPACAVAAPAPTAAASAPVKVASVSASNTLVCANAKAQGDDILAARVCK